MFNATSENSLKYLCDKGHIKYRKIVIVIMIESERCSSVTPSSLIKLQIFAQDWPALVADLKIPV